MNLTISPTSLTGKIKVPASKSISHRAVICAALADGTSHLSNVLLSDDLTVTIAGMKTFGATIEDLGQGNYKVTGIGKKSPQGGIIDCLESGSTIRFLIPLGLNGVRNQFTGRGRLTERPQKIYHDIFKEQNIPFEKPTDKELPLTLEGTLKAGEFTFPGNVSSQFISGLLFALPRLEGDSKIILTDQLESVDYIKLTLDMLNKFGVQIEVSPDNRIYSIKGNQTYQPCDVEIEGDFSQAAFWLVAGTIGEPIELTGLNPNSAQGDRVILDILKEMGATPKWQGTSLLATPAPTRGIIIDVAQCPDIVPILAVLAARSEGITKIINAERLRIKESDRLAAMRSELTKLGVMIEETESTLTITGTRNLNSASVDSHDDHRIAMSMGVASILLDQPLTLTHAEVISKSYPEFWEDFTQLGGKINEC